MTPVKTFTRIHLTPSTKEFLCIVCDEKMENAQYRLKLLNNVRAENFYFQVKFIDCYLREIISFTKKIDIRDLGQSKVFSVARVLIAIYVI